jgi:hypothetical protein
VSADPADSMRPAIPPRPVTVLVIRGTYIDLAARLARHPMHHLSWYWAAALTGSPNAQLHVATLDPDAARPWLEEVFGTVY